MDNLSFYADQVLESCHSTNDIAKNLAEEGYPHGTWVSTRIQTGGRGRLGRKWESLEGNLFLSLVARIEKKELWCWVPMTTAIGAHRYLKQRYPGLHFQIKWPNDLWLAGAKLGGVLCEGSIGGNRPSYIVVGMGLNCLYSPEGLDQKTIDLTTAVGHGPVSADEIRGPVLQSILQELEFLKVGEIKRLQLYYEKFAVYPQGSEISWGHPPQKGFVEGLGPSGELVVLGHSSEKVKLYAEDVR